MRRMKWSCLVVLAFVASASAPAGTMPAIDWAVVQEGLPGALLVRVGHERDRRLVGRCRRAPTATGPSVLALRRRPLDAHAHRPDPGRFLVGVRLRGRADLHRRRRRRDRSRCKTALSHAMTTPGTNTVFGIWGSSPDDLWAVGGASDATGRLRVAAGRRRVDRRALAADRRSRRARRSGRCTAPRRTTRGSSAATASRCTGTAARSCPPTPASARRCSRCTVRRPLRRGRRARDRHHRRAAAATSGAM